MIDGMPKTKNKPAKRTSTLTKKPAVRQPKKESRAKKVAGTVLKIVSGKLTNEKLTAEKAFSDLAQAREQVLYAERHGSREEKRIVRLAFRQYQKMRFRTK
jgi:hypothetical protein